MKVLLTGSAGRIGATTLPRLLDAGHEVRCFDTLNDFPSHPHGFNEAVEAHLRSQDLDFEWIWGDIRDPDDVRQAVDGVDAVVHFAAMTLPTHCEEEWEYCWDTNYGGTRNVVEAIEAVEQQAEAPVRFVGRGLRLPARGRRTVRRGRTPAVDLHLCGNQDRQRTRDSPVDNQLHDPADRLGAGLQRARDAAGQQPLLPRPPPQRRSC